MPYPAAALIDVRAARLVYKGDRYLRAQLHNLPEHIRAGRKYDVQQAALARVQPRSSSIKARGMSCTPLRRQAVKVLRLRRFERVGCACNVSPPYPTSCSTSILISP